MHPGRLAVNMLQAYCKSMPCKFHLDEKAGFVRLARIFQTVKAVTMEPSRRTNAEISEIPRVNNKAGLKSK